MRVLGVDYGQARIGLALSDETALLASNLSVLQRTTDTAACADIVQIATQHGVGKFVVGLPKLMSGALGERAKKCQRFAELLAEASGLPVVLHDERFTTVQAERMLIDADVSRRKRKQVVDAVAATLLLQNYLDSNRRADVRNVEWREHED